MSAAEKLFLGPEFTTWLYFHILEQEFEVSVPEAFPDKSMQPPGGVVQFAIGPRVALSTLDGSGSRTTLAGPNLDDSGELYQAVRGGAQIDSLRLHIQVHERVYEATLFADGSLGSVKLPADVPKGADLEDALAVRSACLDEVERVIDACFHRFLTRRLAKAWADEDLREVKVRVKEALTKRLKDER